jgi:hypothetical protein
VALTSFTYPRLAAMLRSSWVLYATGSALLIGIAGLTWLQLVRFVLLPVVTVGSSVLFVFFGVVIGLQLAISKDQAFIRNAFAKYVPETVVNELLAHPEQLQLGGKSVYCRFSFPTWRASPPLRKACRRQNWSACSTNISQK